MVLLYWDIGKRIQKEVLGEVRAAYGKQVIDLLSDQLSAQYGRGFTRTNLFNMIRFAEVFPNRSIVHSLSGQLSWTHFRYIIYVNDPLAREFYTEMCRIERWSVRVLQEKIRGMLFERTALSKKPEELVKKELEALRDGDIITPDLVFRSPYFLDFLGLSDAYSKKKTSRIRSFASLSGSFLNWVPTSRLLPGRSGSVSTTRIIISTCSFITGSSAGLLLSI